MDALSRLVAIVTEKRGPGRPRKNQINVEVEEAPAAITKSNDIYDDEALLYYVKFKAYKPGSSNKQVKRLQKLAEQYEFKNNTIYIIKDNKSLIVPEKAEREKIITRAHLLGHFQTNTTFQRLA